MNPFQGLYHALARFVLTQVVIALCLTQSQAARPDPAVLGERLRQTEANLRAAEAQGPVLAPEQADTLRQLQEKLGEPVEVRLRPDAGTPRQIKARILEPAAAAVAPGAGWDETTARNFLRANRALLRLDDPDNELVLTRRHADNLGKRHLRFSQSHRGIRVWPADLIVHLDRGGNVELLDGAFVATPREIGIDPLVDRDRAVVLARAIVPGARQAGVPELIVYAPGDRVPRLAWKLTLPVSMAERWVVVIDALNGAKLTAFNEVEPVPVQGSGLDLFGVLRPLNVWQQGSTFYMVDTSKAMFDPTSTPPSERTTRGAIIIEDARNNSIQAASIQVFEVASLSLTNWTPADAVSAAFTISEVYDYYLAHHSRNSIDGIGGQIYGVVRYGTDYDNAFWNGTMMVFGDAKPYAGALDVVAHEMTHGVTEHTANLTYQDQPGALNEAMSDIFGEAAEAAMHGSNDWLIGEDLGQPVRNLANPSALEICCGRNYPSNMSEFIGPYDPFLNNFPPNGDFGGVHLNSTIVSHAFYLLVAGMTNSISMSDSEKIFYRALTVHLVANSQFVDARLAAIQSATELFGENSAQQQATAAAFDAVGISGNATPPQPPNPSANGPDATLFIFYDPLINEYRLGRFDPTLGDLTNSVPLSTHAVALERASALYRGDLASYISADHDICDLSIKDPSIQSCAGVTGQAHSFAESVDGQLSGYIFQDAQGNPENSISIDDFRPWRTNSVVTTSFLRAPSLDGGAIATVKYADSMLFTSDDRLLIYDAFNVLTLADGSQVGVWSIYAIDLDTGATLPLVPPRPGYDIAYPALSPVNDRLIAYDFVDQATGLSTVKVRDLITGAESNVVTGVAGYAMPYFTGDGSAIIFTQPDSATATGASLWRQPLAADGMTPDGPATLWLPNAAMGVIYRHGQRPPTYDLAITKLSAPRQVKLSAKRPIATGLVTVQIQNRSFHNETIADFGTLANLVSLTVQSLGGCPNPVATLRPLRALPITLKPKAKLTVSFAVTYNCPGSFRYVAHVNHAALDGRLDTDPFDDVCPRTDPRGCSWVGPMIKDCGCGGRIPGGTFGADVLTNVLRK